jgi:hypothetical protein
MITKTLKAVAALTLLIPAVWMIVGMALLAVVVD